MDLSNVQITKDCIVTMVHWGRDVITNVCNGTVTEVPWGVINYVQYYLGGFAILILVTLISFLVYLLLQADYK